MRTTERFRGSRIELRQLDVADCDSRYVGWLGDPVVNRHLETRWVTQDLRSVAAFVREVADSPHSLLLAITTRHDGRHIGNLKIGPIHPRHGYADLSYFIGERDAWGRGYATEAIRIATWVGLRHLGLHRLQAGLYGANVASRRALERAGFRHEGTFRAQLVTDTGRDDHLWFAIDRDGWPDDLAVVVG